jgi:sialate O-acetylesterase
MSRLAFGSRAEGKPIRLGKISKPYRIGKSDPVIDISFTGVTGALQAPGEPSGFTVVTPEGIDLTPAYKITLLGSKARVQVALANFDGLQLHYGYGTMAACNITDAREEALPVFGPVALSQPTALLPFMTAWRVSDVLSGEADLKKVTAGRIDAAGGSVKTYEGDFVNEHTRWEGCSGHCYFSSEVELPEAMKLEVLIGYDGPFRIWIGGKPFFDDLGGNNPALADYQRRPIALKAGRHAVHVAMDVNEGKAWGFFLRFRRTDVSASQILDGSYARPAYWSGK